MTRKQVLGSTPIEDSSVFTEDTYGLKFIPSQLGNSTPILEEIYSPLVGFGCYVLGLDVVSDVTKHYKKSLGVLTNISKYLPRQKYTLQISDPKGIFLIFVRPTRVAYS